MRFAAAASRPLAFFHPRPVSGTRSSGSVGFARPAAAPRDDPEGGTDPVAPRSATRLGSAPGDVSPRALAGQAPQAGLVGMPGPLPDRLARVPGASSGRLTQPAP